jgi:RNA polymerase sigma factor (sigma-70 family)
MLNQIPTVPGVMHFVQRFYMYVAVEYTIDRQVIKWKPEPSLQRNLDLYKTQHQQFRELIERENNQGMVWFWLDMALNDYPAKQAWESENRVQQAWQHLSLYCEESCYRAASQVWNEGKYQCWEEYIFLARCFIYNREKFRTVLLKYDPRNSSLNTYITEVLYRTIKSESVNAKFSKWRLLCKKSSKELREALVRYGIFEPDISRFLFARRYFKQVYQINKTQNPANRSGQRWVEPSYEDFEEAARYYNGEKHLAFAPHQVTAGCDVMGEELQGWMEICITALQSYPNSINTNISIEALTEKGREIELTGFCDPELEDLTPKPESIYQQTEPRLNQELLAFNDEQQEILHLYYGLGWNQTQIAVKFGVTQGAIARRLQTIEKKLVNTLYTLKSPPQWVTSYITTWLESNYETPRHSDLIHVALVAAIRRLDVQAKELLRLYYGEKLGAKETCVVYNRRYRLDIHLNEMTEYLQKIQCQLESALIQEIDTMLKQFLDKWLSRRYKNNSDSADQGQSILEKIR